MKTEDVASISGLIIPGFYVFLKSHQRNNQEIFRVQFNLKTNPKI